MKTVICVSMLFAQAFFAQGLSDEDIKSQLVRLIMQCNKEHPVEVSDLLKLQNHIVPKKPEVKCLLACAMKREGIMDSKGLYDLKHGYALAEVGKNGDEQRFINGKKMADICVKANEAEVSDGEKGCDRAALIFKCTVENGPKFGFKV